MSCHLKLLRLFFAGLVLLAGASLAQDAIHHGPSLEVLVQRGEARLPLSLVNHLRSGDRILVRPDPASLAAGEWVLMLASVSPGGNQVASKDFNVRGLSDFATLEIDSDRQVPVILLAPQVRNFFGLNTSLSESVNLLNEVLRSDPQRFYDLQKVDQINQAIQAISQGLARSVSGRSPDDAIRAAKELALKFGVRNLDQDCFKNQTVNTECVATNIVTDKGFSLPSASDLTAVVGNKKAGDLNSFLVANLKLFSEASDYLSSKYRDTYDFAPTFGRYQYQNERVELFSLARFKSGNVKTAYIYVPSWFTGAPPELLPDEQRIDCFTGGEASVRIRGRLPLVNYWHNWRMTVRNPQTGDTLAEITDVSLDQELGRFRFAPTGLARAQARGAEIDAVIEGQFGFDTVTSPILHLALPISDAAQAVSELDGLASLVSGELARLRLPSASSSACVRELTLALPDTRAARSLPDTPATLDADLRQVAPGTYPLTIRQPGVDPMSVPLKVLAPRANVTRVEHAQWDSDITVTGTRLDRIEQVRIASANCRVADESTPISGAPQIRLRCDETIQDNTRLPAEAIVLHRGGEPAAVRVTLTKTAARPRFGLAPNTATALLVTPSATAFQWGLGASDDFITADSGVSLLLRARAPYVMSKGSYQLQLRFTDDPETDARPVSAPLIADFAHAELRTRGPVMFDGANLPGVINPVEFRVVHKPSEQASEWQPLGRSALLLPEVRRVSCTAQRDALRVHGKRLDLIDGVHLATAASPAGGSFAAPMFSACEDGLCLMLPTPHPTEQVLVMLRWVDDRVFSLRLPAPTPACTDPAVQ